MDPELTRGERPGSEGTPRKRDVYVAVALLVFSVAAFFLGRNFPGGAGLFPVVMSSLLALSSLMLLASTLRRVPEAAETGGPVDWPRLGFAVAAVVAFFLLMDPLGAYPAILLFLIVMFWRLPGFSILKKIGLAAAVTAVLWLVFDLALGVPLPEGVFVRLLE